MKLSSVQYSIFHRLCKKNNVSVNNFKLKKDELLNNIHFFRKKLIVLRSCLVQIRKRFIIKHLYPHRNPFIRVRKQNNNSKNVLRSYQQISHEQNIEEENMLQDIMPIKSIQEVLKLKSELIDTEEHLHIKQEVIDIDEIEEQNVNSKNEFNSSKSIVDSLLNKFKSTIKNDPGRSDTLKIKKISNTIDEDVDFTKPSDPNQLPTPIVKTWRNNSAFISENEENYVKSRENKFLNLICRDDCLMKRKSQPPLMFQPERPINMEKARTVAEKKTLLYQNNISYRMVEQESKIFHQIQRKKNKNEINYNLLDSLVHQDVPIKKDPWRALTWLRTTEGKYIYKYIRIDDIQLKLNGSCGNHSDKFLPMQTSMPFPRLNKVFKRTTKCCRFGKLSEKLIDPICSMESIRNFILNQKSVHRKCIQKKTMDTLLQKMSPRPLSKKLEYLNAKIKTKNNGTDDDDYFLGEYESFHSPNIYIEFDVTMKKAPDPVVKKYLQTIIPYKDISEHWINFALSSMRSNSKDENIEPQPEKFRFNIPYEDNKSSMIVRKIIRQKEDYDHMRMASNSSISDNQISKEDMDWTFEKNSDQNDVVEKEIIDVIKDLTNSTFINLNDDYFTKDDNVQDKVIEKVDNSNLTHKNLQLAKQTKSKKMLSELKRLNANLGMSVETVEEIRKQANSYLAKEEKDFRSTIILTDSDTVLLGTRDNEVRRSKRVPKKYDDYCNDDDDENEPAAKIMKLQITKDNGTYAIASSKTEPLFIAKSSPIRKEKELISIDDLSVVQEEVNRMLHVRVDVRKLAFFDDIEPWCLVHCLYKCACKGKVTDGEAFKYDNLVSNSSNQSEENVDEKSYQQNVQDKKRILMMTRSDHSYHSYQDPLKSLKRRLYQDYIITPPPPNYPYSREELESLKSSFDDQSSTDRGYAVSTNNIDSNINSIDAKILSYGQNPKSEILNINQLFNMGMGPIFINIYDDKLNRSNLILRKIIMNKYALVYLDGCAYFVDKTRIDINNLSFNSIIDKIEHPIFILQSNEEVFPVTHVSGDFGEILLEENGNAIIEVNDIEKLHAISDIIENILQNVRLKIEMRLGDEESSPHVIKELPMMTRDRIPLSSSSFHKAPPPGFKTETMQEFNSIFSVRMQRLCAVIKSNTLGLRPSDELLNKFYIYRWDYLLKAFEEDLIQLWQVTLVCESGQMFVLMVLTDTNYEPKIENVPHENIINIKKLQEHNIKPTELSKLILMRIENTLTKNMAVLLYGCRGYFRLCGILNSKEEYVNGFVAKPNRQTHPRLTKKIRTVYDMWYESKVKHNKKIPIQHTPMPSIAIPASDSFIKKKLNTINGKSELKWFLFNITNDFSDIYIKNWSKYLSFSVIMRTIERAKAQKKTILLTPTTKTAKEWPKIYALPSAPLKFRDHEKMTDNFLIFGPYPRAANSNLLLMQNLDGVLLLRDDYERKNNIKRVTRTRCLWIYANTLKCITQADDLNQLNNLHSKLHDSKVSTLNSPEVRNPMKLKISNVVGGCTEWFKEPEGGVQESEKCSVTKLIDNIQSNNEMSFSSNKIDTSLSLQDYQFQPWTSIQCDFETSKRLDVNSPTLEVKSENMAIPKLEDQEN
ncbi:unnamed protein product [Diamesa serratosioi]